MQGGPGATRFFEKGLKKGIEQGEIEILFQPQVSVATGEMIGAEALARWQQAKGSVIGAETLFAAAAQAGLSSELSEYVQCRAVEAAAAWPATLAHLRLSVNITAADVVSPAFAARFLGMVDEMKFDTARVTVEITETELIENLDIAAVVLSQLRERGISVALDDFGTGYSSLLYLKKLPLDSLKIDKRLTEDIGGCERDRIVISGVLAIARGLGLEVVAEGVETQEQLRLLREEGCTSYQGYLCAPAGSVARLVELAGR